MFIRHNCSAEACKKLRIGTTDFCADHHPDLNGFLDSVLSRVQENEVLSDLNLSGLSFAGWNFSEKQVLGCDFSGASFQSCTFDRSSCMLSFFEGADFAYCSFLAMHAMESSFARASFSFCNFSGSNIIVSSFNGSNLRDCVFTGSDLMYTRFVGAHIKNSKMDDCNLKSALMLNTRTEEVRFTYSNKEDAVYEP